MEAIDEIVREFLVESHENLDQLDRDLLALEDAPGDRSRLSGIFRTIHTIKGTSGFLAFPILEHVTHAGESLLVRLRDGELALNPEIASGLLAMVDAVRCILRNIEATGGEGTDEYDSLTRTLEELRTRVPDDSKPGTATVPPAAALVSEAVPEEAKIAEQIRELQTQVSSVTESQPTRPPKRRKTPRKSSTAVKTQAESVAPGEVQPVISAETERQPQPPADKTSLPAMPATPVRAIAEHSVENSASGSVADASVRIDVHLLDKLMNLVGELVLARNQILQFSQHSDDTGLLAASQRLNLITTELQEGVMKTRMQPIRNAWSKLPRIVRDLSISCGKQVQVLMDGAETELDKTILEAIRDPLTHIVRNSVDHGIEAPEVRRSAGKPAEGTLSLRAYHEGGQVIIEIADDGGGVNVDRVRRKALEKGLISAEQAAAMSDREVTTLILLPGFSTAEHVTNVSGRGVGMDVVKTNVEKIGGTLDIQSVAGRGTTLRIRIPLTLAIVPALVVTCCGDRYCIPQVSLLELVRLDGERAGNEIELMHSVPVYRLRGQLLPIVHLDEELGIVARRTHEERRASEVVNIVVLQAEDRQFGLVVDRINDTQEIVVKPLGQHIKSVSVYAGATIMGDGTVSLILDVMGIASRASVLTGNTSRSLREAFAHPQSESVGSDSWLIVDPNDGTRAAIPLQDVARLEEIPVASIERTGRQQVVQYRGRIMPLVTLNDGGPVDTGDAGTVPLVVYDDGSRTVGAVVGRIIDIVSQSAATGTGDAAETRIIAGKVTRIIRLGETGLSV